MATVYGCLLITYDYHSLSQQLNNHSGYYPSSKIITLLIISVIRGG